MVYFIVQDTEDFPMYVKIGRSNTPEQRVSELQTGCAHELMLWFCLPGGKAEEDRIHNHFRRVRRRGEWFNMTRGVYEEIIKLVSHGLSGCSSNGYLEYDRGISLVWSKKQEKPDDIT